MGRYVVKKRGQPEKKGEVVETGSLEVAVEFPHTDKRGRKVWRVVREGCGLNSCPCLSEQGCLFVCSGPEQTDLTLGALLPLPRAGLRCLQRSVPSSHFCDLLCRDLVFPLNGVSLCSCMLPQWDTGTPHCVAVSCALSQGVCQSAR